MFPFFSFAGVISSRLISKSLGLSLASLALRLTFFRGRIHQCFYDPLVSQHTQWIMKVSEACPSSHLVDVHVASPLLQGVVSPCHLDLALSH